MKTISAWFCVLFVVGYGYAQQPDSVISGDSYLDMLREPDSQLILEFEQMLQRCVDEKPDFDISETKVTTPGLYGPTASVTAHTYYVYKVTLPPLMSDRIKTLSQTKEYHELWMHLLHSSFQDERYSYYAALLAINAGFHSTMGRLGPLANKNINAWRAIYDKQRFNYALGAVYAGQESLRRYQQSLFLRKLSKASQKEMMPNIDVAPRLLGSVLSSSSMQIYKEVSGYSEASKKASGSQMLLSVGDAIEKYENDHDPVLLHGLPRNISLLHLWGGFLINSSDKDMPKIIHGFFEYAKAHHNESLFADMAHAAFIVRGYSFDSKTGKYEVNDTGRLLLDYIVAHPMSSMLATFEVLREHWDKDAMLDMVRTHYPNIQTWDEFVSRCKSLNVGNTN